MRNDNAHRERRFYGASADKEIVKEPDSIDGDDPFLGHTGVTPRLMRS